MSAAQPVVATAIVKFANATTPAPANDDVANTANMPESKEATEMGRVPALVPGPGPGLALALALVAAQKTRSHPDSALFRW